MDVNERRRRILAAVQERGMISLREAAELVGTSEVTVRRDLRLLADQGLLRRTHGGAAASATSSREPTYLEKARQAASEKEQIAAAAAELVPDRAAISLGAGTTTLALARRLVERQDLTVVTTSLLVCQALLEAPGVSVLVTGGSLRRSTHALIGPLAEQSLRGLHVDTLFVSGNGLSVLRGLSTPDVLAAAVDQRLADTADRIVVLADHTKVGVEAMTQTVPLSAIDLVITDGRADADEVRRLRDAGVEVTVVEPEPAVASPYVARQHAAVPSLG
ncbi:MAG: DeoR/GlpR family DNA-binding transcription regulator [Actinomycetota bacterium]|nr:DeoR/GlpR family DNA-binding transcription regulator [Actinomycetota bacterium]